MKHAKKKQNTKYTQWNQMSAIICYKSVVLCGFPRRSHSPAHGLSLQTPSCDSFVLQQLLGFVRPSYPGYARAGYQISLFWNVIWGLTQAFKWCSASISNGRLWKITCEIRRRGRHLFAVLFNIKGLREAFNSGHTQFRAWAAERGDKEAIFDNLRWKRAAEDIQTLQRNAR